MIKTGNIYKIICLTDSSICYIGSTLSQVRFRWQRHKRDYNSGIRISIYDYFDCYDIENFKCIRIKNYKVYCESNRTSKQLLAYEQLWINKTNCINKNKAFDPLPK